MAKKDKWSLTSEQRTEANKERKERLAKKHSTGKIEADKILKRIEEEKRQEEEYLNQPCCLVYFPDETSQIVAGAYLDSPKGAGEVAQTVGICMEPMDAGFAADGLQGKVTHLISNKKNLREVKVTSDNLPIGNDFVPVLFVEAARKKIGFLDNLLNYSKIENYQLIDLCKETTSQPGQPE